MEKTRTSRTCGKQCAAVTLHPRLKGVEGVEPSPLDYQSSVCMLCCWVRVGTLNPVQVTQAVQPFGAFAVSPQGRREPPEGFEPSSPFGHPVHSRTVCTLPLLGTGMT